MFVKYQPKRAAAQLSSYWQKKIVEHHHQQQQLLHLGGQSAVGEILLCRQFHQWDRQSSPDHQERKIIPKLVYLHNPWKYIVTKFNLWKLKWLWDYDFNQVEFVEGAKQAAIVMTNIIRQQSTERISEFTTPVGFQQITRDMLLSRNDNRLQLVRFEMEHLRRAIPMKVATRQNFGRKYAFIDMLFVGLRNTKDFDAPAEIVEINEIIRKMDNELRTPMHAMSVPHRIVFAEIFIRFRRDYTLSLQADEVAAQRASMAFESENNNAFNHPTMTTITPPPLRPNPETMALPHTGRILTRRDDPGWSVSFYKILTFDVLNYDPHPRQ